MRYCGREFTSSEIEGIRQLIADHPKANRARLSRLVCEQIGWRRDDGRLKDMSCRVAMLRMQDDGLMQLPPPRNGNNNGKPYLRRTLLAEPGPQLFAASPKELGDLQLQLVTDRHDSHLHNEYLDRYHYLGYQPLPGDQLRYFVRAGERILALLGFGAAVWKTQPRDRFIGSQPRVLHPGDGRTKINRRLATSMRIPTRPTRDLCRTTAIPRYLLSSRELDLPWRNQRAG
jgi:hypothetical protein